MATAIDNPGPGGPAPSAPPAASAGTGPSPPPKFIQSDAAGGVEGESLRTGLAEQVKGAVIWRSGSQLAAQLIAWTSTFLVIRLLEPSDYGLIAMTGVVLCLLNLLNGWGFASSLVRDERIDDRRIGQVFGMLLAMNFALAAVQFALAPLAADFFHQPMIAGLLRVQALFYLANPFMALGNALLSRRMDFRRQSQVHLAAAVLSALGALAGALAGLGVWTLVVAAGILWYAQAIGLAVAARLWIRPRFSLRGAGEAARFGGAMMLVQLFWFVQSQADIFIGGRLLDAHRLGLYTTALFLTQMLATKFVPPLNEVAFAAYARMAGDSGLRQAAFVKTVRLVMLAALPFYFGLAVTAEPFVLTILGDKWRGVVPLVPPLACAMPLLTLQILFAPATNAIGRPSLAVRTGALGAALMPTAFLVGIGWGPAGLAWAWIGGMAALLTATVLISLPAIGARPAALAAAIAPGLGASLAMATAVAALDSQLPALAGEARLAILVASGAACYAALLFLFARPVIEELRSLLRPRRAAAVQPA